MVIFYLSYLTIEVFIKKMKLRDAREIFSELRKTGIIIVYPHAYRGHPEREFTSDEIKYLIIYAQGFLSENTYPSAIEGSFLFTCKDDSNRKVEMAVILENKIIVIHAFRKV